MHFSQSMKRLKRRHLDLWDQVIILFNWVVVGKVLTCKTVLAMLLTVPSKNTKGQHNACIVGTDVLMATH